MNPLTDAQLVEAVLAYREAGHNKEQAARMLDIPVSTLKSRLKIAAQRNIDGSATGPQAPPGYVIWGHSKYYDAQGNVRGEWVKDKLDTSQFDRVIDTLKDAFADIAGTSNPVLPEGLPDQNDELITFYMLADHHLGMYSWALETGDDYDLQIAENLLINAMTRLVAQTPASKTAVILNLGDFFHSDTNAARTPRSGAELDTDTRYAKVLETGVRLMRHTIDLAKQKHERVVVRMLPGNHDPYATLALFMGIAAPYENDPRVEVIKDPSPFYKMTFGKNMFAATHGDRVKPDAMPGVMASFWPKEWGNAEYRYAFFGHVHHKSKGGGEFAGVIWETFQTLAPKDAWHKSMGYSSGRSMTAVTYHHDYGEWSRNVASVKGN